MSYWGQIAAEAWRDTRSVVRLDHWARIALTLGTAVAAGALTWWMTGGVAWSALAGIGWLAAIASLHFSVRLAQIPAERHRLHHSDEAPDEWIAFAALVTIAREMGIPLPRYGAEQNNIYYLEGALQQAAVRGELKVEGRQYRGEVRHNDPLIPIPPEHFRDYGFGHGVLGYQLSNDRSHTANIDMLSLNRSGLKGVTFYDLFLSAEGARKVIKKFADDPRVVYPHAES